MTFAAARVCLAALALAGVLSCSAKSLSQRSPDGKRSIVVKNSSTGSGIAVEFHQDLSSVTLAEKLEKTLPAMSATFLETMWIEQPRTVVVYVCLSDAQPIFLAFRYDEGRLIDAFEFREKMIERLLAHRQLDPHLLEVSRSRGGNPILTTPCGAAGDGSKSRLSSSMDAVGGEE